MNIIKKVGTDTGRYQFSIKLLISWILHQPDPGQKPDLKFSEKLDTDPKNNNSDPQNRLP